MERYKSKLHLRTKSKSRGSNKRAANECSGNKMLKYTFISTRMNIHRLDRAKAELWNICECLPQNNSAGYYYANKTFGKTSETIHDVQLEKSAWTAALKTASTPLSVLYCLEAFVQSLPVYWYASSFRLDRLNAVIRCYESYGNSTASESVAPVAALIYSLDRAIGKNPKIYGAWGKAKKVLGAHAYAGYESLGSRAVHCDGTPIQFAGGFAFSPPCSASIMCTKGIHHSGPCNCLALQKAETYQFPEPP